MQIFRSPATLTGATRLSPGRRSGIGPVLAIAAALVAFSVAVLAPTSASASTTETDYTFENLSQTGTLSGQDNWQTLTSASATVTTPGGSGDPSANAASSGPRDPLERTNDGNFAFPTIPATGPAVFQADLRLTGTDVNSQSGFGLAEFGVGVGFRYYTYGTRQFDFLRNDNSHVLVSFPSRIGTDDWLRLQLAVDMGANTASMFYEDLTLGDTSFSPIAGMQNMTFRSGGVGGTPLPATWNAMWLDIAQGQADNLVVAIPEPASLGLLAAGGMMLLRRRRV